MEHSKALLRSSRVMDTHQSLRKVVESLRKAIGVRGRSRGHSSAIRRRKAQRRRQAHAARGPLAWGDSSSDDDDDWLSPSQSLQEGRAAADAEAKAAADAEAKKAAAEEKAAARRKLMRRPGLRTKNADSASATTCSLNPSSTC